MWSYSKNTLDKRKSSRNSHDLRNVKKTSPSTKKYLKKSPDTSIKIIDIVKDLAFKLDDTVSKEKVWLENFKAMNFDTENNREIQKMLIDSHEMHITSKANILEILKFAVETAQQAKEIKKKSVKKKLQV